MLSGKFAAEKVIVVKHPFENYDDFDYDEIPVHGSIVVLTHPQIIEFKTPVEIELRIDESYPKTQPAIFFRTPIIHPDVDEKSLTPEHIKRSFKALIEFQMNFQARN